MKSPQNILLLWPSCQLTSWPHLTDSNLSPRCWLSFSFDSDKTQGTWSGMTRKLEQIHLEQSYVKWLCTTVSIPLQLQEASLLPASRLCFPSQQDYVKITRLTFFLNKTFWGEGGWANDECTEFWCWSKSWIVSSNLFAYYYYFSRQCWKIGHWRRLALPACPSSCQFELWTNFWAASKSNTFYS